VSRRRTHEREATAGREEARAFFDAIAPRYDRVFAREPGELRAHVDRALEAIGKDARDVLDLGVGTGLELPRLLDAGHRVVGVDVSPEMIALCNKRSRPIRAVLCDFWSALPFDDASFDAVIALFGTLAHAPDDGALVRLGREVKRVLREGGVFFAEVPSPSWVASHPAFVDEKTGARIAIRAQPESAWRDAFPDFDVVEIRERDAELEIRLRSRPSREAR
jgi:SAM-dependent methyltransferase